MVNFDHLVIVTYGRSGSTLLQGLLNSDSDVCIFGENNDFLRPFFAGYKKLSETQNKAKQGKTVLESNSWFGAEYFSKTSYVESIRMILSQIFPRNKSLVGFKEIRFNQVGNQLSDYLDFIRLIWPNTCFVFLTRDLDQVVQSAWWKNQDPIKVKEKLSAFESNVDEYLALNSNFCRKIDYSEITYISESLCQLFSFIGIDLNKNDIQKIIDTPHSSGNLKDIENKSFNISEEELRLLDQKSTTTVLLQELPEFEDLRQSNKLLIKELKYKRSLLSAHKEGLEIFQNAPSWYKVLGKIITINKRKKKS